LTARIVIGEVKDGVEEDGKDKAARALGRKSGKARAESLSKKRRAEIAKRQRRNGQNERLTFVPFLFIK
jgi:hypothetical protein